MSTIVISVVTLSLFPNLSYTVNVTVFVPISPQLNEFGDTVVLTIPQLSVEPFSKFEAASVKVPFAVKKAV